MRPLDGVRVVDVTTRLGAYAGRLLADLGAEVLRVEPPEGAPERTVPPLHPSGVSVTFSFTEAGKRSVVLDLESHDGQRTLERLLSAAHLLITSESPSLLRSRGLHPDHTTQHHPRLVHLAISPFGLTGPYADRPASDLTLLAAGGLLWLGGDPDRAPVRLGAEQTAVIAGVHGATAALIALLVLEAGGAGQLIDLSVQECVAQSLENAAQYFDLEGVVRKRVGPGPVEVGSGLFSCADGWIYVVAGIGGRGLAWDELVNWLLDERVLNAESLLAPEWSHRHFRSSTAGARQFRHIFEAFTATSTKKELYEAGQARGVSICPVSTVADLLANPQLNARGFFRRITVNRQKLILPGAPYRFLGCDVGPQDGPPALGADCVITLGDVA